MAILEKQKNLFRSAPTTERLCYILIFSLFLPFVLTAGVLFVSCFYILSKKEYRQIIFRAKGVKWLIPFSIPLFLSPLIRQYWLGVAGGIGVAILILMGLWLAGVMKRQIFDNCLKITVFMSIPAAIFAYLEKLLSFFLPLTNNTIYRSSSFCMNPNYYGCMIEFVALICLYRLFNDPDSKKRLYHIGVLLLNLGALYLSNSFSACAALGVATVAFLFSNRRFKSLAVVLGLGVAAVTVILLFPAVLPRFSALESTVSIRSHIWGQAFSAFLQNPLFGIGTFGYWEVSAFESYALLHQPHTHNILLDLLLNYGILGFGCVIAFGISRYGVLLKAILRSEEKPIVMLILSVGVAILVHGMTDVTLLWHQTGTMMLFFASGLSLLANRQKAPAPQQVTPRLKKGLTKLSGKVGEG